jgi:ribonuclease HII
LALEVRERALAWSVALASPAEIDALNILQATLLAMRRALAGLAVPPEHVEIDGNRLPRLEGLVWARAAAAPTVETVVRGDASRPAISAASILAKTLRDVVMEQLDTRHPGYGFAVHKGYPTAAHLAALRDLGVSSVHRRSFGPVKSRMT